jgi:hypothetical protein
MLGYDLFLEETRHLARAHPVISADNWPGNVGALATCYRRLPATGIAVHSLDARTASDTPS